MLCLNRRWNESVLSPVMLWFWSPASIFWYEILTIYTVCTDGLTVWLITFDVMKYSCHLLCKQTHKWKSLRVLRRGRYFGGHPPFVATMKRSTVAMLASLGYSDRYLQCDYCPSTSIICDVQQWHHWLACPFLYVVFPTVFFLCNDYHPSFLVVWFLAPYHDGRHGRIMIASDAWRLIVKVELKRWMQTESRWKRKEVL